MTSPATPSPQPGDTLPADAITAATAAFHVGSCHHMGWDRALLGALEAAAPALRAQGAAAERARLLNEPAVRIEPDPDAPGYNRGVWDIDATIAQALAAEREACAQLAEQAGAVFADRIRARTTP